MPNTSPAEDLRNLGDAELVTRLVETKQELFNLRFQNVTGQLDNSARIAQEEVFGPVLVAIPHDGDDDAVAIANDSPYGLSGAVHSVDPDRAWAVARRVRTGTMSVNGGVWYGGDVPFGGYKQSGIGRESGRQGFEEYLETKTVAEPA